MAGDPRPRLHGGRLAIERLKRLAGVAESVGFVALPGRVAAADPQGSAQPAGAAADPRVAKLKALVDADVSSPAMFDLGQLASAPLAGVVMHTSSMLGIPSYPAMFLSMTVMLILVGAIYAAKSLPMADWRSTLNT